jgi:hypothetical protein
MVSSIKGRIDDWEKAGGYFKVFFEIPLNSCPISFRKILLDPGASEDSLHLNFVLTSLDL